MYYLQQPALGQGRKDPYLPEKIENTPFQTLLRI